MGTAAGSSAGGTEGGTALQHSRAGNKPLPQGRVGSRGERGRSLLRRCRATTNLSPEALTSPSSSPGFPLLTAASPGWVMAQSPPERTLTAQALVGLRSIAVSWSSVALHFCFPQSERTKLKLGLYGRHAQRQLQLHPTLPGYLNVQLDDPQVSL